MAEEVKEVKLEGAVKKKRAPDKKRKIFIGVDTDPLDMVKWAKQGHELYFEDGEETFLELDKEIISELSSVHKQRYTMAKSIALGNDVIGTVTDNINGYSKIHDIRPGSAGEQLTLSNRKKDTDYFWSTTAKVDRHMREGFVVDHDDNVKTRFDEAGAAKTVGGQKSPELILMSRPQAVADAERVRKKELRMKFVTKNKETLKETFDRAGVKLDDL